jgi:hypothetical protein
MAHDRCLLPNDCGYCRAGELYGEAFARRSGTIGGLSHGKSETYAEGCRCDDCTLANTTHAGSQRRLNQAKVALARLNGLA